MTLPGFPTLDVRHDLTPGSWLRHVSGWLPDTFELMEQLVAELDWQQEEIFVYGRTVLQPRLTAVCGISYDPASRYTERRPFRTWTPVAGRIMRAVWDYVDGFHPNGMIANWYRDGQDSISWHRDDEADLGDDPTVVSVSLGAKRTMHVRHHGETAACMTVDLNPGDLLVMGGSFQHEFEHSIPKTTRETGHRLSLTFREYHAEVPF